MYSKHIKMDMYKCHGRQKNLVVCKLVLTYVGTFQLFETIFPEQAGRSNLRDELAIGNIFGDRLT